MKVLWCGVPVNSVLVYDDSLVLGDWILKPLTQLKAGANGNGLSIVFVQISESSVGMGFESAVVLWYGDVDDAMAGLAIKVATRLPGQL